MNKYETELELFCKSKGWIIAEEIKIIKDRKYRADYVISMFREDDIKSIIIEVNGGLWKKGNSGHSSGSGILRDYEKSNLAQINGFIYLQYSPKQMNEGLYVQHLEAIRNME